jgi:hypothetical protein
LIRNIHEPAVALVLPELVGAELGGEIKIGETIAIDVRGTESGSVVVVNQLVRLARVVYDPILERDAAGLPLIREPEVVNHLRPRGKLGFLAAPLNQPSRYRGGRRTLGTGRAAAGGEERKYCDKEPAGTREEVRHF